MPDVYLGRPAGGPFGRSVALVATSRAPAGLAVRTCFAFTGGADPGVPRLPLAPEAARECPERGIAEARRPDENSADLS